MYDDVADIEGFSGAGEDNTAGGHADCVSSMRRRVAISHLRSAIMSVVLIWLASGVATPASVMRSCARITAMFDVEVP